MASLFGLGDLQLCLQELCGWYFYVVFSGNTRLHHSYIPASRRRHHQLELTPRAVTLNTFCHQHQHDLLMSRTASLVHLICMVFFLSADLSLPLSSFYLRPVDGYSPVHSTSLGPPCVRLTAGHRSLNPACGPSNTHIYFF